MLVRRHTVYSDSRIWNRYTEKVSMDLFELKWDRNIPSYLLSLNTRSNFTAAQNLVNEHFNKRFQLPNTLPLQTVPDPLQTVPDPLG